MKRSLIVGLAVACALAAVNARAAVVICQNQKGNKVKLRIDACTSKETQVAATELGVVGPEGPQGPPGPAGTARAYAQIDTSGPTLVAGRTLNFASISRISTGVYCLTPTPGTGVDPASGTALVGVEWGISSGSDLLVSVQLAVVGFACPTTDYEVRTFKLPGGVATASDSVGFTIIVP